MAEFAASPKMLELPTLDSVQGLELTNPKLRKEAGIKLEDLDDPYGGDDVKGKFCFIKLASVRQMRPITFLPC